MGMFETWATQWRLAFNGPVGRRLLGGWAAILGDKARAWGLQAIAEGFPEFAADPQSISLHASERQLQPDPDATQAETAAHLVAVFPQRGLTGSPLGMLVELYFAGIPLAVIVQQNGSYATITGTPSLDELGILRETFVPPSWSTAGDLGPNPPIPACPGLPVGTAGAPEGAPATPAIPALTVPWFTFDGGLDAVGNQFNSRFGIILPTVHIEDLDRIRRIVNSWRPAKATCMGLWVLNGAELWDWPTGIWDDGSGSLWDSGGPVDYYAI